MKKYCIIGCGGVGSYLSIPLLKYLEYRHGEEEGTELLLVDGDVFEEKNHTRQICSMNAMGTNKAEYLSNLLNVMKKNVIIKTIKSYVTPENIEKILGDINVIFLCVDNHATRKLVDNYRRQASHLPILISGGNELYDGNVQLVQYDTKSLQDVHPEISEPTDVNPGVSCTEGAKTSPQLGIVNNLVAAYMLALFYQNNLMHIKTNKKHEVFFDINSMLTESYTRFNND
jgi:molybdopterin/thiamine biosynthesis adenylyltransferase